MITVQGYLSFGVSLSCTFPAAANEGLQTKTQRGLLFSSELDSPIISWLCVTLEDLTLE